jgi:hypothetical protein
MNEIIERQTRSTADLLEWQLQRDLDLFKEGVPVTTVSRLIDRSDQRREVNPDDFFASIREEGRKFSGLHRVGNARSYLTIPASPHLVATILRDEFRRIAETVFGHQVELPEGVELFPMHLVGWWEQVIKDKVKKTDFVDLYRVDQESRQDAIQAISHQFQQSIEILVRTTAWPLFWGTCGYATEAERQLWGGSRGGPSNPMGHFHAEGYYPHKQDASLSSDLTAAARYKYYAPWTIPILMQCGPAIQNSLEILAAKTIPNYRGEVLLSEEKMEYPNGALAKKEGFVIDFKRITRIEDVLELLIELAGVFEIVYQQLMQYFAEYHKTGELETDILVANLHGANMDPSIIEVFTRKQVLEFVLGIRPTHGQLLYWQKELQETDQPIPNSMTRMITRYQKLWAAFEAKARRTAEQQGLHSNEVIVPRHSIRELMAYDVCRPVAAQAGTTNWPVHNSFSWFLDPSRLKRFGGKENFATSIRITPTVEGKTVERLTGVYLER